MARKKMKISKNIKRKGKNGGDGGADVNMNSDEGPPGAEATDAEQADDEELRQSVGKTPTNSPVGSPKPSPKTLNLDGGDDVVVDLDGNEAAGGAAGAGGEMDGSPDKKRRKKTEKV